MLDLILSFTGIVIMLMISLVTIAYFASKALNIPGLEVFAKVELYEIFISVLILIFALGLFGISDIISNEVVGAPRFDAAIQFQSKIMLQGVYPATLYCYKMIWIFSTLNTFQMRPNDSVWTWVFKVCPGSDAIVGIFNLLSYGLVILLASLNVHMYIITFIKATMEYFFLPAGILLRFFPPTRKAGVFVITLAIALFAVYPTVYAINMGILDKMAQIESGNPSESYVFFDSFKANAAVATAIGTPFVISTAVASVSRLNDILSHFPLASTLLLGFAGFLMSEFTGMVLQPYLFWPALESIASLSLATFFIPALSMVATIAFINGVTNFIDQKVGS